MIPLTARFALLATLAFLALSTLSPFASAWGNWTPEEHRYFIPGPTNWSHASNTYAVNGQAYVYGGGYVTYSFTQAHANGLRPDVIRFRVSDAWSGGACWYQVIAYPAGTLYDTGWTGCGAGIDLHHAPSTNNVQYDIRLSYSGNYDTMKVSYVEVLAIWEQMGTYIASFPRASSFSAANPTASPGTCIDVAVWWSAVHATILEVDWGDGLTSIYPMPPSDGYTFPICHSYPPSAAPYQMCLRARETNGLQRTTPTECANMYWYLPRIV